MGKRTSLVLGLFLASSALAAKPPNVVILLVDDIGYADVSFNGRREWTTINIHRLSQEGTIFRRWYAGGVDASSSFASLLTGRQPIHTGVMSDQSFDLPGSEITIAEALKPVGYSTGIFGQWFHGPPRPGSSDFTHPLDQGFDEFFGALVDAAHTVEKFPHDLFDGRESKAVDGFVDTLITDRAIDFAKRHRDQAFFMLLSYAAPSGDPAAPAEDIARFKGKFQEQEPEHPINAVYAAQIYRLDQEIGRVLRAIDEIEATSNTIVLFTGGHGQSFTRAQKGATIFFDCNRPFRGQRGTLWEGGMRVPAVVRWPDKVLSDKGSHAVLTNCDVLPTLLAAAGIQPDPNLKFDGQNLLDVWKGKAKETPDRMLCWDLHREGTNQQAVMHGDFKMVITGGNAPEIFNVEYDPAERRNLAADCADEIQVMRKSLTEWLATQSDAAKQTAPVNPPQLTK